MKYSLLKYAFFFIALAIMSSCNLTRLVPKQEKLLVKNKIKYQTKNKTDFDGSYDQIVQKPNRKILGLIKFHLWAYQAGAKGVSINSDTGKIRSFLINKVGEAPVQLDSNLTEQSAENLRNFYFNSGYFNAEVEYVIKKRFNLKKRAEVEYRVKLGKLFRIHGVQVESENLEVQNLVFSTLDKSYLQPNKRLQYNNISKERERVTELLKNNGYFYFNNSAIDFQIDTNQFSDRAVIKMNIRAKDDDRIQIKQRIHKVEVVLTQKKGYQPKFKKYDGIDYDLVGYKLAPEVITKHIILKPGDLFSEDNLTTTYAKLLGLDLFKYVDIEMAPSKGDSINEMDLFIYMEPALKYDFIWEPQIITTEQTLNNLRNYGIGNVFTLRDRNVFGKGESFNIYSITSLETQFRRDSLGNRGLNFRQNMTFELAIPRMLFLEHFDEDPRFTKNYTKIDLAFQYEKNDNFQRFIVPFTYSYTFKVNRTNYLFSPISVSFNRAQASSSFLNSLGSSDSIYIQSLLTNNLILGPKLTLYFNTKEENSTHFWYIQSNLFEIAGNLLNLGYNLGGQSGLNKELLGTRFSQFFRTDIDASFNQIIDENNTMVYRIYSGIGIPFGNSNFLPFERRYFVGGSNSLRAWRPRTIGPGGYDASSSNIPVDKTGEILLQGNLEYRFDIIEPFLNGAIFLDAGNIWNFSGDSIQPNSVFEFKDFYQEIALNTGMGLRMDLSFFILRLDWGIPLHDPSLQRTDHWIIKEFGRNRFILDRTALNIAVGYPF